MIETPSEWSVDNGAFVGFCRVLREAREVAPGKMTPAQEEDWLPYAIDLRPINGIKQFSFEEPHLTSLFHNGEFVACVNAPFSKLVAHWIGFRHIYDTPEFYDPGHPSNG